MFEWRKLGSNFFPTKRLQMHPVQASVRLASQVEDAKVANKLLTGLLSPPDVQKQIDNLTTQLYQDMIKYGDVGQANPQPSIPSKMVKIELTADVLGNCILYDVVFSDEVARAIKYFKGMSELVWLAPCMKREAYYFGEPPRTMKDMEDCGCVHCYKSLAAIAKWRMLK